MNNPLCMLPFGVLVRMTVNSLHPAQRLEVLMELDKIADPDWHWWCFWRPRTLLAKAVATGLLE